MDGAEIRARRKSLKMSQAEFGQALGLTGDFVGRLERGTAPIEPRTAAAIRAMKPASLPRLPRLTDPVERIIEKALIEAGIDFTTDDGGGNESRLDFYLPAFDVAIEVKRFYSPRTGEQMARAPNVIVAQGITAVNFLATALRSGDFFNFHHDGR